MGMPCEGDGVRAKMRTVMPWVLSLGAHAGVLILASLTVFAIKAVADKREASVPDMAVGQDEIEGLEHKAPGPVGVEVGPLGEGAMPPPDDLAPALPTPPSVPQGPGRMAQSSAVAQFVRGPSAAQGVHGRGTGTHGNGIFNVGTGDRGGEKGGQRAANRIVFLVDASGSLVDTLPFVVESLSRQIESDLDGKRKFNVIFFSGAGLNQEVGAVKGLAALFPSRLESASPGNQIRAVEWIHRVQAGGCGDPLSAFRKALDMDPDQIHLLSDNITGTGIWEMHQDKFMDEALKAYRKAQARRQGAGGGRIDIKTYQFVYRDPVEQIGKEPTLLRLAKDTGGDTADYHFVTAHSLGLR